MYRCKRTSTETLILIIFGSLINKLTVTANDIIADGMLFNYKLNYVTAETRIEDCTEKFYNIQRR